MLFAVLVYGGSYRRNNAFVNVGGNAGDRP